MTKQFLNRLYRALGAQKSDILLQWSCRFIIKKSKNNNNNNDNNDNNNNNNNNNNEYKENS